MMKIMQCLMLLTFRSHFGAVHASEMENGSGHDVGNPGESVRMQVAEARKDAAVYILTDPKACVF